MKGVIIILLAVDICSLLACVICYFLLYGETAKLCRKIAKQYTIPIRVICTDIDQKVMNQNYSNGPDGYGGNTWVRHDVSRPYFIGQVNGKTYTFVRTKDIRQPKCSIGKTYTLYVRQTDPVDCRDFYEAKEIERMNVQIQKKKKQYAIHTGCCLAIMFVLLLDIHIFFPI